MKAHALLTSPPSGAREIYSVLNTCQRPCLVLQLLCRVSEHEVGTGMFGKTVPQHDLCVKLFRARTFCGRLDLLAFSA